jgi:hypothetical protein
VFALNFYSPLFVDQLRKGRKTATIRLGDKSHKYKKGQLVWVTVGHRHGPRQKIFTAIIDLVDVKPLSELTQRDIERDNPEFRLVEDTMHFLSHIYSREVALTDTVSVVHFSEVVEFPSLK